jgi:hypothetical protein
MTDFDNGVADLVATVAITAVGSKSRMARWKSLRVGVSASQGVADQRRARRCGVKRRAAGSTFAVVECKLDDGRTRPP